MKRVLVEFELRHPVGRWVDLDVRTSDLSAVSRTQLGLAERRCIICDRPAKECARSRRHPVEELYQVTMRALEAYAGM
ncbi:MAG: citrate lyase holo-[acyl-carrier protein] synthase [Spirochaetales bacterium]|nr:citrate lyase holo-[acyl-carrier protein] synthase [Spirochaetales bacterium]